MTSIATPPHLDAVDGLGEVIPPGEADAIRLTTDVCLMLLDTKERPVRRGQHPKSSGLVRAELIVEPDLPPTLRHGLFAEPRTWQAVVRFSNGRRMDDRKGDAHGCAIKLLDVPGEKILEAERDATTHDLILLDNPVFFFRDAEEYATFCHATQGAMWRVSIDPLARKSMRIRELVIAGAIFVRYYWKQLRELRLLKEIGSKRPDTPLGVHYWSTTPYRLGPHAVKYALRPHDDLLLPVAPAADADALRDAMTRQLDAREARFDLLVQLRTDPDRMPVEDPRVRWDERRAPWTRIATLRIPAQQFATEERLAFGEQLSFTPWHALPEHRPLGGINRVRRAVYETLSRRRHELNGAVSREPTLEEVERVFDGA